MTSLVLSGPPDHLPSPPPSLFETGLELTVAGHEKLESPAFISQMLGFEQCVPAQPALDCVLNCLSYDYLVSNILVLK